MTERNREDGGEYAETYAPESALDVFQLVEKPYVTTKDVADALNCSHKTARRKMGKWDDHTGDGTIRREKISGSAVVWWLPQDSETR